MLDLLKLLINQQGHGTSGRTRTGTLLRAGDFESPMSTNSITLALALLQLLCRVGKRYGVRCFESLH